MRIRRRTAMLLPAFCALALGACGDDDDPASSAAPTKPGAPAAASSQKCRDVEVPGHQAVDVQAAGVVCGAAEKVAADAEGRGRAPYESGGFACRPSDAGGGDTRYRCAMGGATVTFRYATA